MSKYTPEEEQELLALGWVWHGEFLFAPFLEFNQLDNSPLTPEQKQRMLDD